MTTSPALQAKRRHHLVTFAVLILGGLAFSLFQSAVVPALPVIQRELGASQTATTWILTSYLFSGVVLSPIIGRLGDMFGKRRMIIVSLAVMTLGMLVAALATKIGPMLVGRALQGAGAGIFPLSYGIVRDEFPTARVPTGIALLSALMATGSGLGVVIAGPITELLSYHWLFWMGMILLFTTLVLVWAFVPESPGRAVGRVHVAGALLLAGWMISLLLAITQGVHWGWADPRVLALFIVAVGLLYGWARAEARAPDPLIDMRMMRLRGVWTANVAAFLVGGVWVSTFVLIPQFVQSPRIDGIGFGASLTEAGVFLLPSTVMLMIASPLVSRMATSLGASMPLIAGGIIECLAVLTLLAFHDDRLPFYVASGLLGLGLALSFSALANLVVESVPIDQTGVATGMNSVFRQMGGVVAVQVVGSIIAANLGARGFATEHGFELAFAVIAVVSASTALLGLMVPRAGRAPSRAAFFGAS